MPDVRSKRGALHIRAGLWMSRSSEYPPSITPLASALHDRQCRAANLVTVDRERSARTVFIQKALTPVFQKEPTPFADCMFMDAKLGGDHFAGQTAGAAKNDSANAPTESAPRDDVGLFLPDGARSSSVRTKGSTGCPAAFAIVSLPCNHESAYNIVT